MVARQLRQGFELLGQVFFGPWTIRPVATAFAYFWAGQFSEVRIAQVTGKSPAASWFSTIPSNLVNAAFVGFALWMAARLFNELSFNSRGARVRYVGAITVAVVLAQICSIALGVASNQNIVAVLLSNVAGILVFTGFAGVAVDQVSRQAAIAELALEQVEQQREQLLQADEAARREVADYLHNSVQATLVVVGLQLRSLAEEVPDEQAAQMRSLVEELETVRMRDIRRASRRLSPDIRAIGLNGALKELASNYADTMRVHVTCEVEAPEGQAQLALAVYRIVEQCLLNAAVHGRPETCDVVVARSDERMRPRATPRTLSQSDELPIVVTVTNDGAPLTREHSQGAGSAVISAWVQRFKGSWTLQTVEGKTQMRAIVRFPNTEQKVA